MILRIVRSTAAPTAERPGEKIWMGGYKPVSEEGDGLSSSVIATLLPGINVGSWLSANEVIEAIRNADWDAEALWTAIDLVQPSVEKTSGQLIHIKQGTAASMICSAMVSFISARGINDAWVRFE